VCGISGRLNTDLKSSVDGDLLAQMTQAISHRGPDGSGQFVDGPVGLGHRRLSIIDLHTGGQPISNEDGTVHVVYNGEIYNYRSLRAELESRGHQFRTTSDTEVIVHMYEEEGDLCVSRFEGMFAFALWDSRKRRLLLARDRVGIKPLYYTSSKSAFLFASEIKAILVDPEVDRTFNFEGMDRFLTYYYLPGEATLIAGIRKLLPGHYLTVEDGRIATHQYWDLDLHSGSCAASFDDCVAQLHSLLQQSVSDHLISDVPVGVLLSGGVDSSGVLSLAAGAQSEPLHTFTVGFDQGDGFADERPYARAVAERYAAVHHETTITAQQFRDFLPNYVWHMEEPVCEPPAVALYFLSKLARETGVKVLLSGEGGDEAFAGYPEYRNFSLLESLKSAFGPARGLLRSGLAGLAALGWERVRRYGEMVDIAPQLYYYSRTATPATPFNKLKPSLYSERSKRMIHEFDRGEVTRKLFGNVRGQSILAQMLYVDTKTWLPDDLLVKADKMTMATSVELRVPLLDTKVLQFAARLPNNYKLGAHGGKRILKEALRKALPPEILSRKKAGFPVPYVRWLRSELKELVFDTLTAPNASIRQLFEPALVSRLLAEHGNGGDYSKEVFSLLVLELWLGQFVGRASAH
jgi:asparagine synthase (glutamine-hydrolysing)